jgi:hypothetical protein
MQRKISKKVQPEKSNLPTKINAYFIIIPQLPHHKLHLVLVLSYPIASRCHLHAPLSRSSHQKKPRFAAPASFATGHPTQCETASRLPWAFSKVGGGKTPEHVPDLYLAQALVENNLEQTASTTRFRICPAATLVRTAPLPLPTAPQG